MVRKDCYEESNEVQYQHIITKIQIMLLHIIIIIYLVLTRESDGCNKDPILFQVQQWFSLFFF